MHTWKATAEETGGAFLLFEDVMEQGKMTPLHTHPEADETMYVLEGEILMHLDGAEDGSRPAASRWRRAGCRTRSWSLAAARGCCACTRPGAARRSTGVPASRSRPRRVRDGGLRPDPRLRRRTNGGIEMLGPPVPAVTPSIGAAVDHHPRVSRPPRAGSGVARGRTRRDDDTGAAGTTGEARLPAALAVLVAIALYALLPETLLLCPRFVIPALGVLLLVALVVVNPRRLTRQTRLSRVASLALVGADRAGERGGPGHAAATPCWPAR